MKLKFLFISLDNLSADLAWQVSKEGHEVKYHVQNKGDRDVADGFVEKINSYKEYIDWADVIVFDDVLGHGGTAQELRSKGKLVLGGTSYTDMLEDDRSFGQEELKRFGIEILPYKDFRSFDEAIKFVKDNPKSYVIKPTAETPPSTKGLLFIGEEKDGADVIQVLNDYKESWADSIPAFQLQEKVNGIEIAVGAFFNGKEFMNPININFEHKKLFPGNLGPSTGEMGTSMFWTKPNNLFNQTLKKFEKKLMDEKFTGYIDLNCIANESGIYPLEFTTRFGYPTIFIQAEGITEPIGGFLYKIASGEQNEFKTKPGFQIGVRIVVPPFPFNDDETFKVKSKGSMIYLKGSTEGIHIEDVKIIKNKWVVAGTSGVVMTICGTGNSIREAQEQAYSRIKTVNIPRMYSRTDIGDRWYSDRDKLNDWGYISDINRMRFKGLNENNLKEYQLLIVESENLYPEALRTSFEDFKDILSAPNSIGLIAFIDEHYIGNCVGSEPSDSDLKDLNIKLFSKDDKLIYVYNLIVTEQFQGKGYGQRLMDEFIKKAKAADYKYVLGNFRQNASYKITKKYKVVIEKLFKNWEDSGEDFVFCVMEI